jgi:enoyl-CoA hydratase/carnithine racemase
MSTERLPGPGPAVLTVRGAVAWIELARPEALNAIDDPMISALHQHLDRATAPDIRVVVLAARGRAFCAGADLKIAAGEDGSLPPATTVAFVHRISGIVRRLAELPKPVIAAVNGLALAGGLEVLLACDLVIAVEDAEIGDQHAMYGLLPGAGSAARLPRVVGETVAKYLMFTGARMRAGDLVAHGLVNEVVPAGELTTRVTELAEHLARRSPLGLATMKRLVDDGLSQPLDTALRLEAHAIDSHAHSPDFAEGLAAFRDRREPAFPDLVSDNRRS